MNRLATFSLCMVAALVALPMFSQGIVVCKKDGTRMVFPYETIDSVVTYNYDEEPPTGGGGTSGSVGEDKVIIANGVSFTMKPVAGGTFTMGATSEQQNPDSDEKPTHTVTLSDYYIGETEVTQELWTAVMGSNPSGCTGNMQHPVEHVSWDDCQTFIQKLNELTGANFRLPTEAEWEFAARGGRNSRGYQYSGSSNLGDVAWYWDNSSYNTHPVKTKSPNELGIYDMSGNVEEWCQDWYGDYSSSSQTNPTGPSIGSNCVFRGGSSGVSACFCRSAYRSSSARVYRDGFLGLRLVL